MVRSVRNFDDSREVRELLDQGIIGDLVNQASDEAFFGYFSRRDEQEFVLFRDDVSLKLRNSKSGLLINIDDTIRATHEDHGTFCTLVIYKDGLEVIRSRYIPKRRLSKIDSYYDLTQRSEERDDFGRFIRNVIEEPGRKTRIFPK